MNYPSINRSYQLLGYCLPVCRPTTQTQGGSCNVSFGFILPTYVANCGVLCANSVVTKAPSGSAPRLLGLNCSFRLRLLSLQYCETCLLSRPCPEATSTHTPLFMDSTSKSGNKQRPVRTAQIGARTKANLNNMLPSGLRLIWSASESGATNCLGRHTHHYTVLHGSRSNNQCPAP